jgi:hypothetical protein
MVLCHEQAWKLSRECLKQGSFGDYDSLEVE